MATVDGNLREIRDLRQLLRKLDSRVGFIDPAPGNYDPGGGSVGDHLGGIDEALGIIDDRLDNLEEQFELVAEIAALLAGASVQAALIIRHLELITTVEFEPCEVEGSGGPLDVILAQLELITSADLDAEDL